MPTRFVHLARQTGRRIVAAFAVTAVMLSVAGCGQVVGSTTNAEVRVLDASPDAVGLDIYENTMPLAYNLGFGTFTSYIPVPGGVYTFSADASGTRQVLSSAQGTFNNGTQYSILLYNVEVAMQELILTDQSQPAPSGQQSIRFIDVSTRIGAVDIYLVPTGAALQNVRPVVTNLTFGVNAGYINVPNGPYQLVILPAGTVPTGTGTTTAATLYQGATFTNSAGSAHTIVLIDQQLLTTPGLNVVTLTDYVSPTATS